MCLEYLILMFDLHVPLCSDKVFRINDHTISVNYKIHSAGIEVHYITLAIELYVLPETRENGFRLITLMLFCWLLMRFKRILDNVKDFPMNYYFSIPSTAIRYILMIYGTKYSSWYSPAHQSIQNLNWNSIIWLSRSLKSRDELKSKNFGKCFNWITHFQLNVAYDLDLFAFSAISTLEKTNISWK